MEKEYTITDQNLHIFSSYKFSKKDFGPFLLKVQQLYPDCPIWRRGLRSLELEWAAHNCLFLMGICTDRTVDVDLEYPQSWYNRILYPICGALAWLVIE